METGTASATYHQAPSLNSGIASIFALAKQYHTTTGEINNLTSKSVRVSLLSFVAGSVLTFCSWSIFLLGERQTSQALVSSLTRRRNRMGRNICSGAHSSLWPLASALLVSSTREAVECPTFTDHFTGSRSRIPCRLHFRTQFENLRRSVVCRKCLKRVPMT